MADAALTKRQLVVRDTLNAATVLARAFSQDPLWLHLLPDARQRVLVLRQSFRATLPWYIQQGQTYGVGQPLDGVAIWRPPLSSRASWTPFLNPSTLTLLFSPLLRVFGRALPIFTQFERMHTQYVQEPHYYLSTIGVVPERHGQGCASLLIKPVLALADKEGYPSYTETMTPSNVPLYEHYGFICQEEYRVPDTRLTIWSLYRPARTYSA